MACRPCPQIHQRLVGVPRPQRIEQGLLQLQNRACRGGGAWAVVAHQPFSRAIEDRRPLALERMLPAVVRPMPGNAIQSLQLRGQGPQRQRFPHAADGLAVITKALPLRSPPPPEMPRPGPPGWGMPHPSLPVGSATANWVCCSITSAIQMP